MNKIFSRGATLFLALFFAQMGFSISYADQCGAVTKSQARLARAIIKKSKLLVSYCELCSAEDRAIEVISVEKASIHKIPNMNKYWEVVVTGTVLKTENGHKRIEQVFSRPLDLAYVFVETGLTRFVNISKFVGCESQGVSEYAYRTGPNTFEFSNK